MLIVPSPERKMKNKSISIRRFFVFTAKGGIISDGNIIEFVAEKSDVKNYLDDLLKNMTKDGISNFSGWISKYDINYGFQTSYVFKNGKKSEMQSKIVVGKQGQSTNIGPVSVVFTRKGSMSSGRGSLSNTNGSVYCEPIMPISVNWPANMCADAIVSYRADWVADQNGCLTSLFYNYLDHTCPNGAGTGDSGSGSGEGSAAGSGESGSGSSETTGGGNPNYGGPGGTTASSPAEIIDLINNPCLKSALATTLGSNLNGKIAGILDSLGKNTAVKLYVADVDTLSNGRPARTHNVRFTTYPDGSKLFEATISLNKQLLVDSDYNSSSKEYVVGTIIHEALHAYFRETTGVKDIKDLDHQTMATQYIQPMAEFLSSLFQISMTDASAIAWKGVQDSEAYQNATSFTVKQGNQQITVTKENMNNIGSQYYINQLGTSICPTN